MRPWLVTGAAGFIGFHVARRIVADGIQVVGVDDLNAYYDPALKAARVEQLAGEPAFDFVRADVSDEAAMSQLFAAHAPEVVIHLAAQPGVRYSLRDPMAYVRANVGGTVSVLEAARRHDVGHVVYASSSSVYGASGRAPFSEHEPVDHPLSLYGATKRAAELAAHSYSHVHGLPTTGLRFFTVYGPWGRPDMACYAFALAMHEGQPITVFGDGSQLRDFTYIDDIVDGVVAVARKPAAGRTDWSADAPDVATSRDPFRLYNVGHGEPVSVNRVIGLLEAQFGVTARRHTEPADVADVELTHADPTDLLESVGEAPTTSIEDGLGRFCDWFREYHA